MAVFDLCKHLLHFVKNKVQLKLFGGGQSKIMGGNLPHLLPPGYAPNLMGSVVGGIQCSF